jgi:hypothetical protein
VSFRESFRQAFSVESDAPFELTDEERGLAEALCRAVVARRLTVPALILLEVSRPLSYVGSQAVHFLSPLISSVSDSRAHQHLASLLERRRSIEYLCTRIEQLESQLTESAK